MRLLAVFCFVIGVTLAHKIQGRSSIEKQLKALSQNTLFAQLMDKLPYEDTDFINNHLEVIQNFNGSECDACKNKMKYARKLYDEDPGNQHLISLMLFNYCVAENKGKVEKCSHTDFFLTTQAKIHDIPADTYDSGLGDDTSVDFFDNDFMQMLKRFNFSSELDLEYFCFYKEDGACDLPETPNVDDVYDFKWPDKQPHHFFEPKYNVSCDHRETFNVLHITDFHSQLRYTVGAEADCDQKTCCMIENYNEDLPDMKDYNFTSAYYEMNGNGTKIDLSFYPDAHYSSNETYVKGDFYDLPAGRGWDSAVRPASTWGGYKCDSPVVLINNTMKQIAGMKDKKFEFSLFTGDLVDHDEFHCTPEVTKEAEILGFQIMKHYLGDIPVFPSLGNHDTFPYAQLAPQKYDPNNSYQYNTDLMSELWIKDGWLPADKQPQLKEHYTGFSTVTRRGLKVISLNSNAYYQKNLWSYINLMSEPDKFGQWEFLIDELIESEQKGERVWIMAHIPSGDTDTLPVQSRIFAKIVERFSPYTIANIFYGHTHRDEFKVLFSSNSSSADDVEREVVNMAWIAQSVTPRKHYNPSFRYYEVEDQSFNVLNAYNYYAELNETFVSGGAEPKWQFEYSARDVYDPDHTWPEKGPINATFWNEYVLKNILNTTDLEFNQKYIDFQYRHTPGRPICDDDGKLSVDCYNENYCEAGNFFSDDFTRCLKDD